MLLPIAMEFNKPVCAERLAKVAVAMGVDTTGMSTDEAADAAIAAVKQLSADMNIPHVCEAMKADEQGPAGSSSWRALFWWARWVISLGKYLCVVVLLLWV